MDFHKFLCVHWYCRDLILARKVANYVNFVGDTCPPHDSVGGMIASRVNISQRMTKLTI